MTGITDPTDYDYIRGNLLQISVEGSRPYNCYVVRDTVYGRADGTPLTSTDFIALNHHRPGQVHKVTGEVGDMTCKVHTEIDSSG